MHYENDESGKSAVVTYFAVNNKKRSLTKGTLAQMEREHVVKMKINGCFIRQRAKLKDFEAELQQCNDQMKTNFKAQQKEIR